MAIDLTTLTAYTWSDVKLAAMDAMMKATLGGADLTINGRRITRISVKDAAWLYGYALEMIALESADGGNGTALVQFGERA